MKPELLKPGEVTLSLPPGVDFRDPQQADPYRPRPGQAADYAALDALLYGRGAVQTTHIPHDQLMQQSMQAQLSGLGSIQQQGQQAAFGSPMHAAGVAIARLFRP